MNPRILPQVGDLIVRTKFLGLTKHVGVVIGFDQVLHNTPEKGEYISTIQEFGSGFPVTVYRSGASPAVVIVNASRILANPKEYDVLQRNCEHTATETAYGRSDSPQLKAFLALVCLFAVMGIFAASSRR